MSKVIEIVGGVPVAVPLPSKELERKIKRSKFAKLIRALSDDEVKALVLCLVFSPAVKEAIDCWAHSVEHGTQVAALQQEFQLRGLGVKPELQIEAEEGDR